MPVASEAMACGAEERGEAKEARMSASGSRSLGAYRLLGKLGESPTGAVFLGEGPRSAQLGLGQVVVKVLADSAEAPQAREAVRQVGAVAALEHPGVIPLFGLVQEHSEVGIAMAYAPGGSLGDVLARGGSVSLPLAIGVVSRMIGQLARTLQAAHEIDIVHGDLRPSNVFVRTSPQGRPLAALADFGQSAKVMREAQALVSVATAPADHEVRSYSQRLRYVAPEQFHGHTLPASDQYALALLACEWLTGQHPVAGSGPALLANLARGNTALASVTHPALDGTVRAVLARALAPEPGQRFASIAEFGSRLEDALAVAVPMSGVTMEMASLGQSEGAARLPGSGSYSRAGSGRYVQAAGGSGLLVQPAATREGTNSHALAEALDLPAVDAPQKFRKRLAVAVVVVVMLAIGACSFGVFTMDRGVTLQVPHSAGNFAGPDVAATQSLSTSSVISPQDASTGKAELARLTSPSPTFTDALAGNSHHWPTSSAVFFGGDKRLHVVNSGTTGIALADAPGVTTGAALAARVNISLVRGFASDSAGMRFFVSQNADGTQSYYAYLISAEGRFGVWLYDPDAANRWALLTGGYSSAIRTGMGATNELAVATDSTTGSAGGSAFVFANGQCIGRVPLNPGAPARGQTGLMVLDGGAEAAFSDYAVYNG